MEWLVLYVTTKECPFTCFVVLRQKALDFNNSWCLSCQPFSIQPVSMVTCVVWTATGCVFLCGHIWGGPQVQSSILLCPFYWSCVFGQRLLHSLRHMSALVRWWCGLTKPHLFCTCSVRSNRPPSHHRVQHRREVDGAMVPNPC